MKKIIIFDFNRTLYDPDLCRLIPQTRRVLRALLRRGFELYLVSRAGASRKELIRKLGLLPYFSKVIISKDKGKKDFMRIAGKRDLDRERSFVVGDRVRKEIAIGNSLGFKTVWLRAGKFAHELPCRKWEYPSYTVSSLPKLLHILSP